LLDAVTDRVAELNRDVGAGDRAKLEQYLDAVRDVERRIQMAEAQSDREIPVVDQPAGIPDTFGEHARLMFDLLALARHGPAAPVRGISRRCSPVPQGKRRPSS